MQNYGTDRRILQLLGEYGKKFEAVCAMLQPEKLRLSPDKYREKLEDQYRLSECQGYPRAGNSRIMRQNCMR